MNQYATTTEPRPVAPLLWEEMNRLLQQPQYRCKCYDTLAPGFTKVAFIGWTSCGCGGTVLNRKGRTILAKVDPDGLEHVMENFSEHRSFEDN